MKKAQKLLSCLLAAAMTATMVSTSVFADEVASDIADEVVSDITDEVTSDITDEVTSDITDEASETSFIDEAEETGETEENGVPEAPESEAYTTADGFVIENNVLTKYSGSGGNIVIPEGVTEIADEVFKCNNDVRSVTFPTSLKKIGYNAFRNNQNLTSVNFAEGLEVIGNDAFCYCLALKGITFPSSIRSVGDNAFRMTGLTSVTIPKLDKLGAEAFADITDLVTASFAGAIKDWGTHTFAGCSGLKTVTLHKDNTILPQATFYYCESLDPVTIPSGVTEIGRNAFCYAGCTSVTIPVSVKKISSIVFDNSKITDIYYEGSEEEWKNVEKYSSGITSSMTIHFGKTVIAEYTVSFSVSVGTAPASQTVKEGGTVSEPTMTAPSGYIFGGWYTDAACKTKYDFSTPVQSSFTLYGKFTEEPKEEPVVIDDEGINWKLNNGVLIVSGTGVVPYCAQNPWHSRRNTIKSVIIDKNISGTGWMAFSGYNKITSLSLSDSVTGIAYQSFASCTSLKSVDLPNSVKSIGYAAFSDTALEELTLPASLGTASADAFPNCHSLKTVTFDEGTVGISGSFYGCDKLMTVKIPDSVRYIDSYVFKNCKSLSDIYFGGSEEQWKAIKLSATSNKLYWTNVPSTVTVHFNSVISGCPVLVNGKGYKDLEEALKAVANTTQAVEIQLLGDADVKKLTIPNSASCVEIYGNDHTLITSGIVSNCSELHLYDLRLVTSKGKDVNITAKGSLELCSLRNVGDVKSEGETIIRNEAEGTEILRDGEYIVYPAITYVKSVTVKKSNCELFHVYVKGKITVDGRLDMAECENSGAIKAQTVFITAGEEVSCAVGAITASQNKNVTSEYNGFVSISGKVTVNGKITAAGIAAHGGTVNGAVTVKGTAGTVGVNMEYSTLNGDLSINLKNADESEFYISESKINGKITSSNAVFIQETAVSGAVTCSKDIEISECTVNGKLTSKQKLYAENDVTVLGDVSAEQLYSSGGTLTCTGLSVTKNGLLVDSYSKPLTLKLIKIKDKKTGYYAPVPLDASKNQVAVKKFIGSFDDTMLLISAENCANAKLSPDKTNKKLIAVPA